MKKFLFLGSIILIINIPLAGCAKSDDSILSEKIMERIDELTVEKGECRIRIDELTDFEWEKMVVFHPGCSNKEMSDYLDVTIEESFELKHGYIFLYRGEIIYKEYFKDMVEVPSKFQVWISNQFKGNYMVFTPEDAIFTGERYLYGNPETWHYTIEPVNAIM